MLGRWLAAGGPTRLASSSKRVLPKQQPQEQQQGRRLSAAAAHSRRSSYRQLVVNHHHPHYINNEGRKPSSSDVRQRWRSIRRYASSSSSSKDWNDDDDDARYVSILDQEQRDRLLLHNEIPLQDVRNVAVIAHIDHGKSSMSSRLLELTGNLGREAQQLAWNKIREREEQEEEEERIRGDNDSTKQQDNHERITESSSSSSSSSLPSLESPSGAEGKEQIQALDTLSVEQERGITVKASTATMLYKHPSAVGPSGTLLINMYDTPGHIDFGREVTRSLAFVQGAVLLLDASQGVQAQTWSVYEKCRSISEPFQPQVIFALTKIDLESARPVHCALTLCEWLDVHQDDPDRVLHTSARNRVGVKQLLDAICEQVPPPRALPDDDADYAVSSSSGKGNESVLRAQVVDSWYDALGVNCLVRIVAGHLKEGMRISVVNTTDHLDVDDDVDNDTTKDNAAKTAITDYIPMKQNVRKQKTSSNQQHPSTYPVQEVGLVLPRPLRTSRLGRGQLGYVRFGLRDPRLALPGTSVLMEAEYAASGKHGNKSKRRQEPILLPVLPIGNNTSVTENTKSVLYASVHPIEADAFDELVSAVDRLALNDTGLEVQMTSSVGEGDGSGGGPFLGPGLKVGFQGLLHVEVFRQRPARRV